MQRELTNVKMRGEAEAAALGDGDGDLLSAMV